MKRIPAVLSLSVVLPMIVFANPLFSGKATGKSKKNESVPGELIVKLKEASLQKSSTSFESVANDLQKQFSNKSKIEIRHFKTSQEFAVFHLKADDKDKAMSALNQDPRVAYAEPNFIYHALDTKPVEESVNDAPNDTKLSELWGMKNTGLADSSGQKGKVGADIHATQAWAEGIVGRKEIKVAVIDTGIDYTHPDLADKMWVNPAEIADDGKDNDGNGFIDDVRGWNFNKNNNDPRDDNMHGTHCAGTIGAIGNNGMGVAGVNWKVTLIPIKFLSADGGGTLEAAMQSIQYATQLGVNVMSNSWGGGGFSQGLYDVIAQARDKKILFVAAAGNDGSNNDTTPSYPGGYALENVISVAATDNLDRIASFSNYGKTSVHVAAPGVRILSTTPNNTYSVLSGTSMATPHVAGVAALMLSANPSLTYAQIKDIMMRSSDPVRGLSKKVASKGRVNVYNALHEKFPEPAKAPDESRWKDVDYKFESPHPYESSKVYSYPIKVTGAKYLRVVFDSIDTEPEYDQVVMVDATGEEVDQVSGVKTNYTSDYLVGHSATVLLRTDDSMNQSGFKVSKVQAIY